MLSIDVGVPTRSNAVDRSSDEDRRLENVFPRDWKNPSPVERYDLVVVGAGTAGLVSAAIASALGATVALVERMAMGGDCLNIGCVPSKALIRSARSWHSAKTSSDRFGGPEVVGNGNFAEAMDRMRRLRANLSRVDSAARFRDLNVDVFLGDATFTARDALIVKGNHGPDATLRFKRAIIATGGRASELNIDGLKEIGYLTNETVFDVNELPTRLIVIGGGPIGCELGQTFARFGSDVTIVNAGPRLLLNDDQDAARILESSLRDDGVSVHHNAKVVSARSEGVVRTIAYVIDGKRIEIEGDAVLVAAGRSPNVEGLGLDIAGVSFDKKGIEINDRFRTSNKRIFAIGDCASKYQFTHAADAQARAVIPNALLFGLGGGKASDMVMPWCTYTSPEVAHVGMTAKAASDKQGEIDTVTIEFGDVDRAVLDGDSEGFLRVYLEKGKDRILGATLVSDHAGETISEITVAMVNGIGLSGLGKAIHPYPTHAEAIRKAADANRRKKFTPLAKKLVSFVIGLVR